MDDEALKRLLFGIDLDLPQEGGTAPQSESIPKAIVKAEKEVEPKKVFVQKIITEIWVYTDVDNKVYGQQGTQDIHIIGEMGYEEAMKLIGEKKTRRRKNP